MMVVDSSALIAILLDEPEKTFFERTLAAEERNVMSAVNTHEVVLVLRGRQGAGAVRRLWHLIETHSIEVVPFDEAQVHVAAAAFDRYGKGIDPKAKLNLCDCAAYALAKTRSAPLLFKGDDFIHTDLVMTV